MAMTMAEFWAEAERLDPDGWKRAKEQQAELEALRKDADRYRWLRDAPRADVRIVGRGARKGDALDATVDELRGAA